jgi:hypothetical protein
MSRRGRANKNVVQNLKDEKLRKIRYELRTLLRMEKEKRINDLHEELVTISYDKSLSYTEYVEKTQPIVKNQEKLRLAYSNYPLCCGICGDRIGNLVYNPVMYQWRCVPCYEQAHKNFPTEYP